MASLPKLTAIVLFLCLLMQLGYAQEEYIDRSFGENGTVTLESDSITFSNYNLIGVDSLDNVYICHSQQIGIQGWAVTTSRLIKLDKNGERVTEDFLLNPADSTSSIAFNNNTLLLVNVVTGSTIVQTFDLDYNYLGRIIIPSSNLGFGYYQPNALKNGGIDGEIDNIYFRYNTDGTLDNSFSNDGLFNLTEDSDLSRIAERHYLRDWVITDDNSIVFTGYGQDKIDSFHYPITLKLSSDGVPDESFGNSSIGFYKSELQAKNLFENTIDKTTNDNLILSGTYQDTLDNYGFYMTRIDEDGEVDYNFADNGLYTSLPSANHVVKKRYLGKLSNGSLLLYSHEYTPDNNMTFEYLTLTNEQGEIYTNFGTESKVDLTTIKGDYTVYQFLGKDGLYLFSREYAPTPKAHITKLKFDQILANKPQAHGESNFILFPNPLVSKAIVQYDGPTIENVNLSILNMHGQLLQEQIIPTLSKNSQIPIELPDNISGTYLLKIKKEDTEIWSTKLIKTN